MTASIKMRSGELWEFHGLGIRFEREIAGGLLHFQIERTLTPFHIDDGDGPRVPDWTWVLKMFAEGSLVRPREAKGPRARQVAERQDLDPETIDQMDKRARLRLFVLRGFDAACASPTTRAGITKALRELWLNSPEDAARFGRKPSPSAVARWMSERGEPGDRRLKHMVSMTGRVPRRRRLRPEIHRLMDRFALRYWSRRGWSQSDAYAMMACLIEYLNERACRYASGGAELKLPAKELFRRRLKTLECYDTYAAKFGEKKAAARFKPTGRGLEAARILRLGCIDHTFLDGVAVIDADEMLPLGRPWLTALLDVKSRCVVGFVLGYEPPSIYSAMECVKRANQPKVRLLGHSRYEQFVGIHGRFDEIVVDNGWEFSGVSFEDAMADLGTSVRWAPIASPTYKAVVERFFGTLNTRLNRKLPGATLKPELLRELGYDPYKEAVLTIEELDELIWEAIGLYHLDLHRGLEQPPGLVWQRDARAHGVAVIGDVTELDKMLGAVRKGCELSRSGVRMLGLQFHDQAKVGALLHDLIAGEPVKAQRRTGSATAKVKVKFNPANLAEIHVWNSRRNRYVTLPCTDERYACGISLWHHQRLREWTKLRGLAFSSEMERLQAKADLARKIESMAPELKQRQRRSIARLITKPVIQDKLQGVIELHHAPARHDGLAPTIESVPLAFERTDKGAASCRPARKSKPQPPKRVAAAKNQNRNERENAAFVVPAGVSKSWKDFE